MTTKSIDRTSASWLYAAFALAVIAGLIVTAIIVSNRAAPTAPPAVTTANDAWFTRQTSSAGQVTVQVMPALVDGDLVFTIVLDTHSVDLDRLDLTQLAALRIDGGAAMKPATWNAPAGGHHLRGTLTFTVPESSSLTNARVIELIIRDVGGVPERSFRWTR